LGLHTNPEERRPGEGEGLLAAWKKGINDQSKAAAGGENR